jgi:hypothetical protein
MEAGFGTDLAYVEVYRGPEVDGLAKGTSARAFTAGNDVYFAKGQYAPGTARVV